MYSYEDRIRAVELYINCGKKATAVAKQLGYPSARNLRRWYRTFIENGNLPANQTRRPKFSQAQKQAAVEHYFHYGQCLAHTKRSLGYPSAHTLASWINEIYPGTRKTVTGRASDSFWSVKQKRQAVIDLCSRQGAASEIADKVGVSRQVLYKWKDQLLDDKVNTPMKPYHGSHSDPDRVALEQEVDSLQVRIHRLQLEHDILIKANELLKKDQGVDLELLSNREKTQLVDALRGTYPLSEIITQLQLPRSSYFYHKARMGAPDKYSDIRRSVADIFDLNHRCYGYRRVHVILRRCGTRVSEKVVRRLMAEEELVVPANKRRRYSSYNGEVSPAPDNLINRDFKAERPNQKWLTDLTEFHIPSGKVYLSPIIDCFDGLVVSWTIGARPDADLVNTMLDEAIETLSDRQYPMIHSDRGAHYRWPGWLSRIEDAHLIRSMSAKGCSPDNAACEGFFGRMKNEFFYPRDWRTVTLGQFMEALNSYLRWYNDKRIKKSLGGLSPMEYRSSLGLAA